MRVGLIDVDGHHYPNLALMRISTWHKSHGDTVEWWWTDMVHYDIVYMSKVFSDAYTKDVPEPLNADRIVKGGTGYSITTENGKEVYNRNVTDQLPLEMEKCFPDYSIYPQFGFAVAMTSRGCPRGCGFCHVTAKEGRCAVKVADVKDFWNGQKEIQVLDPNITACKEKRDLFRQYRETGAVIEFNQGLDIRLLNEADIADINAMRLKKIHFAWDNPADRLAERFEWYTTRATKKPKGRYGTVYILTNYEKCTVEEHVERALMRINAVTELQFDPYLMVYDKPHAPRQLRLLQRWCNNKRIFRAEPDFYKYDPSRG